MKMENNFGQHTIPTFNYADKVLTFETQIDGIVKEVYKESIDFKEKCVRDMLIKIGWTPPGDIFTNANLARPICNRTDGLQHQCGAYRDGGCSALDVCG